MRNSLEVVEGFFKAINAGDFNQAKKFMADNHEYHGPMFSTNTPDAYFEELKAFEMEFAVETQDMIVAKDAVTHVAILKILKPQVSIPTCEVFKIKKGKIARQSFYFDTALFPKV
ncbi:nuclear transport factor 2 family protein [Flavivirga jejuensis]|uniref:Nuclear transport factor 2 family protein n=1 Tax=Flavivirga jejuensis TaxID=870487 RepID=A0ABT8WJ60_9FLAO|nr:nuclear transport factor 2 family protein [Flavivirga jejuensis]MDO5973160.1 nuclear transport factor 2 family protein [Flavivirga jejuensis]